MTGKPLAMGPLTGTVFAEFAPLYESAWRFGITPSDVDQMEIWQLAAAMGLHKELEQPLGTDRRLSGDDLIRARYAAAARGEDGPEAAPMATNDLQELLSMGQAVT